MKVILFGATGMVGQGVLRECLLDPDVEGVLAITRTPLEKQDPKLRVLIHKDFTDFTAIEAELWGYDACFFCLGSSSVGMTEEAYHRITYDFTVAAAKALLARNPAMSFTYVSGTGTDSTEKGGTMWARVKGKAENAILAMPFKGKYMFRPGVIQPLHGVRSRTRFVRILYVVFAPLFPLLKALFPAHITTTEKVGRAMLAVAKRGSSKTTFENRDINVLSEAPPALPSA
jgi:uncharacterized protein YbjT (DUF2867 family)